MAIQSLDSSKSIYSRKGEGVATYMIDSIPWKLILTFIYIKKKRFQQGSEWDGMGRKNRPMGN